MATTPNLADVVAILKRRLPSPGYRAFLFGSRAAGRGRPASDWDIGILGPTPVRGAILESIREDLEELRTLHTFDVVDLATVPDEFRAAAMQATVQLI
jgi:predicted nucleotidyltransferase